MESESGQLFGWHRIEQSHGAGRGLPQDKGRNVPLPQMSSEVVKRAFGGREGLLVCLLQYWLGLGCEECIEGIE